MSQDFPELSFKNADPALSDFQYLEDLSTAYWYSEIFFAAIELCIFQHIHNGNTSLDDLAKATSCKSDELYRLLKLLESLCLLGQSNGIWYNSQIAGKFLTQENKNYLGDFFRYRKYMQPHWQNIVNKISPDKGKKKINPIEEDYYKRTYNYVSAMDSLINQKVEEITSLMSHVSWSPPVLDIGGGAGSLGRALIDSTKNESDNELNKKNYGVLFDLPEVIQAAKTIYSDEIYWNSVRIVEGDFREFEFCDNERFGLIVLSNFLHAYGEDDAKILLEKVSNLLTSDGIILIHDYFPDRRGRSPQKGQFYDVNMMLNTFNGVCHESSKIKSLLEDIDIDKINIRDLSTDTSIIIASNNSSKKDIMINNDNDLKEWEYIALDEDFQKAVLIPSSEILTAPWVQLKCKHGCPLYGKVLQCPPNSLNYTETEKVIKSFNWALLLEDMPPGREFHNKLLALEKRAFLAGFYKAFSYGAGPCTLCDKCPNDGICRYPEKTRPSMEGSGIDVFGTVKKAKIELKPAKEKNEYVKYIGLLLLE